MEPSEHCWSLKGVPQMRVKRSLLAVGACLALASCGETGDSEVTVLRGSELAPADLTDAGSAAARYLPESHTVLFVSDPVYSGSCPPPASAERDGDGVITLTIKNSDEDTCTDDGNPYTFLVTDVSSRPSRLVVSSEAVRESVDFDLSGS